MFFGKKKTPEVFKQFNLSKLWHSFTKEEQQTILDRYGKEGGIGMEGIDTPGTAQMWLRKGPFPFLINLLSWFKSSYYYGIQTKIIHAIEAQNLAQGADVVDLHFYYLGLLDYFYRPRNPEQHQPDAAIDVCKKDIALIQQHPQELKMDLPTWPYFPTMKQLAIIYEKAGEYEKAIQVCEIALKFDQDDHTKGGYQGRIQKLQKKLAKKQK